MKLLTVMSLMNATLIPDLSESIKKSVCNVVIVLLALGFYATPIEVQASFTKVTPDTLKFEGIRYWRKKASEATLGAVGTKRKPAAGKNYFQHIQDAPNGIYKVKIGGHTTISTEQAKKWNVTASHSNISGSAGGSGKYKGKITAYKMVINLGNRKGDLRYETNRHIKHLQAVKEQGKSARLVSAVWVLVKGQEQKNECYEGDLTGSYSGLTVNVTAKGCSKNRWKIAPGSILAYEIVKINGWNNDELTQKPSCPSGYKYETRSSATKPMDRCVKTTIETVGIECKLLATDKAKNWSVVSKSGRDICKSAKGKKNKDVKCKKSSYNYSVKSGRDECTKPIEAFKDTSCPNGYDYDKKSSNNKGVDICELKGIASLKQDSQDEL